MTTKEKVSLERIDQKLDDLKESFDKVAERVECHERDITRAKGVVVGLSTMFGIVGALVSKFFWGGK